MANSSLVIFARQFASMIGSSLELAPVLDNLARETPGRALRAAIRDVARQVTAGADLADAMAAHPRQFDGVFVGLVRAGMEAGRLAGALLHVVEYLDRMDQVNRRARTATVYPAFVLLTFLGVAGALIFYVLPQYDAIFRSFHRDLPAPTRMLLGIGDVLRADAGWLAAAAVLLAALAAVVLTTPRGRLLWDRGKLRVPVLGPVWRLAALARFSRTLAVQVGNGVSAVRALRLAATAAGNGHVALLARGIADDVELGASVTEAFRRQNLFAGVVLQMIAAGDEAGRLDELLISAASYFDGLLMQRIEAVTSLINPLLTAFMGVGVAGMLVAAFLPVFDLPNAMGG